MLLGSCWSEGGMEGRGRKGGAKRWSDMCYSGECVGIRYNSISGSGVGGL